MRIKGSLNELMSDFRIYSFVQIFL